MSDAPKHYEFEVWQGDECVASVGGADYDGVKAEAFHYALMYAQDGEGIVIKDVSPSEEEHPNAS